MSQETWSFRDVRDHVSTVLTQVHLWWGRHIEPLEKLPEALDAAARILDHDVPAGVRQLEAITTQIGRLKAEMAALETDVAAARERASAAIQEARDAEQAARAAIADSETRAASRETDLTAEWDAKRAHLVADYNGQLSALSDDVRRLRVGRDELQAEVEALRRKFAEF